MQPPEAHILGQDSTRPAGQPILRNLTTVRYPKHTPSPPNKHCTSRLYVPLVASNTPTEGSHTTHYPSPNSIPILYVRYIGLRA